MPQLLLSLLAAIMLAGCGSSRTIALRVFTDPPSAGDARAEAAPVHGAYVQVIPIEASPVPLPLNSRTLDEALNAVASSGFTDVNGVVRFSLSPDFAHDLAVSPPPMHTTDTARIWRGRIGVDGAVQPDPMTEASGLRVERADR